MAVICGEALIAMGADCANPLTAGTHEEMLIINPDDMTFTTAVGEPLTVDSITMKTGKKALPWTGIKNSNAPTVTLNAGEYQNNFTHQVDGLIFDTSIEAEKEINNISANSVPLIAIVHKRDHGATGKRAFRIYGLDSNVYIRALTQVTNDTTTLGAWAFTLQTLDGGAPSVPHAFFDTDYATTLAAFEALKTPGA